MWDKIIVDRKPELAEWVEVLKRFTRGRFRFWRSPTITMRGTDPAQSSNSGNSGDGK